MKISLNCLLRSLFKAKAIMFVFVLVLLNLSGCSKVEYEQHCVPELRFQLWENTPFVLLKQVDEPSGFMKEKGYEIDIAFQIPREDFPSSIHNVIHAQADGLLLLGPVIRYVKPLFNPFTSTTIYFYAKVDDHNVWITYLELRKLATAYSSPNNQDNFTQLMTGTFDLFERSNSLQCVAITQS